MSRNNTPSPAVNPKLENTPTFYSGIAVDSTAFAAASRELEGLDPIDLEYHRLLGDALRSKLNSRQRLIVMCLAHHRATTGNASGELVEDLVEPCSMSKRTILKHAKVAEQLGFVSINGDRIAITEPEARKAVQS